MVLKKKKAEEWLFELRKAAKGPNFKYGQWFLISTHALECHCREFTEKKIVELLTSLHCNPSLRENNDPSATAMSYKIVVKDTDSMISGDRRKCELAVLLSPLAEPRPPNAPPLPIVISAWREGSPHANNPKAPLCKLDPKNPHCKKSRRPVGRI